MTFEELQQANKMIKATPLKGKDYAEVNQRIKAFRSLYPEGQILTELISNENGVCIFKATISGNGKILGTGTAYEVEGSSFINKSSYIENCETSAVGRALAMCGIGIDVSIASFEEVGNAITHQAEQENVQNSKKAKSTKAPAQDDNTKDVEEARVRAKVLGYINRHQFNGESIAKLCGAYKVEKLTDLTAEQCRHYIGVLEKKGGNIDE